MDDFNDIKSSWGQRSIPEVPKDGYHKIIKSSHQLSREQLMGQLILSLTVVVLICFFFYVSGFKNTRLTWGMSLMVVSLLFRIGVEFFSKAKLKKLTPALEVKAFSQKIMAYYNSRLFIHTVLTPLSFITYIIGFISILPVFKLNVSAGFYQYIVVSAILSFIFLIVLISIQIKKELSTIKEMKKHADRE